MVISMVSINVSIMVSIKVRQNEMGEPYLRFAVFFNYFIWIGHEI